jgi:hypothetical protein
MSEIHHLSRDIPSQRKGTWLTSAALILKGAGVDDPQHGIGHISAM